MLVCLNTSINIKKNDIYSNKIANSLIFYCYWYWYIDQNLTSLVVQALSKIMTMIKLHSH